MYKELIKESDKTYIYVDLRDEEHVDYVDKFIEEICVNDISFKDYLLRSMHHINRDKSHKKDLIQITRRFTEEFLWSFVGIETYDPTIQTIDIRNIDLHKKIKEILCKNIQ